MTLKGVAKSVGHFFSIVKSDVEKVAPEIQWEIDRIMRVADAQVEALKSQHSVQAIVDKAEAEIKAVKDTAAHHVALIEASRDAQVSKANTLLPPVPLVPVAPVAETKAAG